MTENTGRVHRSSTEEVVSVGTHREVLGQGLSGTGRVPFPEVTGTTTGRSPPPGLKFRAQTHG